MSSPWAVAKPAGSAGREPAGSTPGSEVYPAGEGVLEVKQMALAWAWGAEPATARVTYTAQISDPAGSINDPGVGTGVPVGAYLPLYVGQGTTAYTFHGVCVAGGGTDSSGGKDRELVFADLRFYLGKDVVHCILNQSESKLVQNEGTGLFERKRYFRHQLPGADFSGGIWTTTDAPYTAAELIDILLGAPSVGSPWLAYGPQYHPVMLQRPVLGLDFSAGERLDSALLAVSERLGMQFTLVGYYKLRWRRRGEWFTSGAYADPNMPWASSPFPVDGGTGRYVFPPGADQCQDKESLATAPTRVFVTGERDQHQVLNLEMVKDWAEGWEAFTSFDLQFVDWVCAELLDPQNPGKTYDEYPDNHPEDPGNSVGRQRGLARALGMTVRQAAALLVEGAFGTATDFLDNRKFGGRSRGDMPVKLYLEQIVWRCYRLPPTLLGRAARHWTLVENALVVVGHDVAGVMTADFAQPVDGNGYAIAKGYNVGSEMLRHINPDKFDLATWVEANLAWAAVPFNLDPGAGEQEGCIVFDQPVYDATDIVTMVGPTGHQYPRLDYTGLPTAAVVRASLTLAGPRFQLAVGTGSQDAALNEPGLFREVVENVDGTVIGEIGYADGETPATKATALANTLITGQTVFRFGGFKVPLLPGDGGIVLNGGYERLSLDVGPAGVSVSVSFATERGSNAPPPPRQFDRAVKEVSLFPGQAELRQQMVLARVAAAALRQNPAVTRNLSRTFNELFGSGELHAVAVTPPSGGWGSTTVFQAGTPLWRSATDKHAVAPSACSSAHPVLAGVVGPANNPVTSPARCDTARRVLVRAMGPVAAGDNLGRSDGHDYVVKDGTDACLVARGVVASGQTHLVWADFGGGGGSVTVGPRWR